MARSAIELKDEQSAGQMRPPRDESYRYRYIIMPMRIDPAISNDSADAGNTSASEKTDRISRKTRTHCEPGQNQQKNT